MTQIDLNFNGDKEKALGSKWVDKQGKLYILISTGSFCTLFDVEGGTNRLFTPEGIHIYKNLPRIKGPYIPDNKERLYVVEKAGLFACLLHYPNKAEAFQNVYELTISTKAKVGDTFSGKILKRC